MVEADDAEKIAFKYIWQKLPNSILWVEFSCRFAFLSTKSLRNRTPKIRQILTMYQANVPTFDKVQFFKT